MIKFYANYFATVPVYGFAVLDGDDLCPISEELSAATANADAALAAYDRAPAKKRSSNE